jgi:methionyl-tRNA formyltransferase
MVVDEGRLDVVPGRVVRNREGGIYLETGKGIIEIKEIQYPGKKRLSVSDFLRGFSLPEGTLFGK